MVGFSFHTNVSLEALKVHPLKDPPLHNPPGGSKRQSDFVASKENFNI